MVGSGCSTHLTTEPSPLHLAQDGCRPRRTPRPERITVSDTPAFLPPRKVDPKDRPPSPTRGGRQSLTPAYTAWLTALEPGAEWEFDGLPNGDGKPQPNTISRLNALRSVAKDLSTADGATQVYKVDAVPIDDKHYRIFASVHPKAEAKSK